MNFKLISPFGGNWLVALSYLGLLAPGFALQDQGDVMLAV